MCPINKPENEVFSRATKNSREVSADHENESVPLQGRVLLVAYHFPPDASSTGRLRTLGFMRHLPAFGWQPAVLTAQPRAYERMDEKGVADIPSASPVRRAFALDTRRHLGWRGKYFSWLAVPDRWISWWPDAVRVGLRMIRAHQIDVIWSTYPIMTSHLVALALSRITGLPWVADFRDPVASNGNSFNQRVCRWIERRVVARADRLVFTTPGAKHLYKRRFQDLAKAKDSSVIPNGYEEEVFSALLRPERSADTPCTLVHGGLLYRRGRNPAAFFRALARLKSQGAINSQNLRVILRASGHEIEYQAELERLDLANVVDLAPPVSYRAALQEQAEADGLLLFQGPEFNAQIPAKVYEYLRIGVPIIAFTETLGDTAALLREVGGGAMSAPMEDDAAIADILQKFLWRRRAGTLGSIDARAVQAYSRQAGAERLAGILAEVTNQGER